MLLTLAGVGCAPRVAEQPGAPAPVSARGTRRPLRRRSWRPHPPRRFLTKLHPERASLSAARRRISTLVTSSAGTCAGVRMGLKINRAPSSSFPERATAVRTRAAACSPITIERVWSWREISRRPMHSSGATLAAATPGPTASRRSARWRIGSCRARSQRTRRIAARATSYRVSTLLGRAGWVPTPKRWLPRVVEAWVLPVGTCTRAGGNSVGRCFPLGVTRAARVTWNPASCS